MIIFWPKYRDNTVEKAKASVLWMCKQPRSGHLLLLSLFDQVIEGIREDTNRWAAEWLQLFRK